MPESSFPQVLGYLNKQERRDPRKLAAIYLGSTFVPTPLEYPEIVDCMRGEDRDVLDQLALATAVKVGRDPSDVEFAAWKTVRTIGMHRVIEAFDAKVVILRRHPHNVFESQFRFGYGVRNRKPLRYAFFHQSYEWAFSSLRVSDRLEIAYDDLPGALSTLAEFIGLSERGMWPDGSSHFERVVDQCSWLSEITKDFENRDSAKRANLDQSLVRQLDRSLAITNPLRIWMGPVRRFFDRRSLGHVREIAARVLKENPPKL